MVSNVFAFLYVKVKRKKTVNNMIFFARNAYVSIVVEIGGLLSPVNARMPPFFILVGHGGCFDLAFSANRNLM